MVQVSHQSLANDSQLTGKASTFPSCRANYFRVADTPKKEVSIAVAAFDTTGTNVMSIVSSGHEIDVTDTGSWTLMVPTSGTVEVNCNQRDYTAKAGEAIIVGPTRRRTRVSGPESEDFKGYLLKVRCSEVDSSEPNCDIFKFSTNSSNNAVTGVASTRYLLDYIFADLVAKPSILLEYNAASHVENLLRDQVRGLVGTCLDNEKGTPPLLSQRRVWEAERFMRVHFAEPLKLSEIASAINSNPRRLQAAFRHVTGMTPWTMLTSIRLEEARIRLLDSGPSGNVTSIAFDCGITHLGRFAKAYRTVYGESPHETLLRGKTKRENRSNVLEPSLPI